MSRSNEWVGRTLGYLADWRAEAAERYTHINLGTIIIFGDAMESIDAPIRKEPCPDNDNSQRAFR